MTRILIVEGERRNASELGSMLEARGFTTTHVASCADARVLLGRHTWTLVLSAHRLPDGSALDLLHCPGRTPLIVVSDRGSIRAAVDCIRGGAADFLVRPVEAGELVLSVERALRDAGRPDAGSARETTEQDEIERSLVGQCPSMRALFDAMRKVGPTDHAILLHGESGTGKERVARTLHALSPRRSAPFATLNCAALPQAQLHDVLFGESGREGLVDRARRGTLFPDEVGSLPLDACARLLHVLECGEARDPGATAGPDTGPRLIAATQSDLRRRLQAGSFREDLYYRLNVVSLDLPPLRERGDDIVMLAGAILERRSAELGRAPMRLSDAAWQAIRTYSWPGNVREMENAIERAVLLSEGRPIEPADLAIVDLEPGPASEPVAAASPVAATPTSLEDYFVQFVLANQDHMTETELAEKLGISRKSLWERRHRLDIPRKRTRKRGRRDAPGS